MHVRRPGTRPSLLAVTPVAALMLALLAAGSTARAADEPTPHSPGLLHPIFVGVPHMPHGEEAHQRFSAAVARRRLGPVEVMDLPMPPPPRAKELLRQAKALIEKLKFAEAEALLDAAAAEAMETGGEGLDAASLADLFLHQAVAAQRADWKDLEAPLNAIEPAKARQAYLRAATLLPTREVAPRRFSPRAVESWKLALAEVKARPRGAILVRAASSALVSIDMTPARPGLHQLLDLPFGEHFVRVEDPGRRPFAAVVSLVQPTLEVDSSDMPPATLPDADAAAHARRQGAPYALVAELAPGRPVQLQLRVIDAHTGSRLDATSVAVTADPAALEAAVMRLDEQARSARFVPRGTTQLPLPGGAASLALAPAPSVAPPPGRAQLSDDPRAWARDHWPLLTAVGVALGAALVLGAAASDEGP